MNKYNKKHGRNALAFGRPRLLTHDEILEAALELGLETLTMNRLAERLNVATPTLYQYFESRKALVRAAAVHSLSEAPVAEDTGQHWSLLARDYVYSFCDSLMKSPSQMLSYHYADYGFEVNFEVAEGFLEAMAKRDFEPKEAMSLLNMVSMLAFAAAVEGVRQREFEIEDETMSNVARRQINRMDSKKYRLMKQALGVFTQSPAEKVEALMFSAFRSFAHDRGEDESIVLRDE